MAVSQVFQHQIYFLQESHTSGTVPPAVNKGSHVIRIIPAAAVSRKPKVAVMVAVYRILIPFIRDEEKLPQIIDKVIESHLYVVNSFPDILNTFMAPPLFLSAELCFPAVVFAILAGVPMLAFAMMLMLDFFYALLNVLQAFVYLPDILYYFAVFTAGSVNAEIPQAFQNVLNAFRSFPHSVSQIVTPVTHLAFADFVKTLVKILNAFPYIVDALSYIVKTLTAAFTVFSMLNFIKILGKHQTNPFI